MSSELEKEKELSLSASGNSVETERETIPLKVADLNFSVDSGMEEPVLPQSASDESDDEEIVCKRKVKRKAILDDDDSDGDGETKESSLSPSNENEENNPNESTSVGDEDDDDLKLNFENLETEKDSVAPGENDRIESAEIDEDELVQSPPLRMDLKDNDLFDAESDEENTTALADDDENQENNSTQEVENENDEGFVESQIDPTLLAKLKKLKGASKTPKQKEKLNRKAKPTAEQMSEIYSESQRMLRDSRVNLPYYEPETKSLDDFLARASKKRQEYSVLNKPKDIQKAWIIHEKLAVTPPEQSPSCHKKTKNSLKDKAVKNDTQNTSIPSDTVPVVSNEELPDINPIFPQATSEGSSQRKETEENLFESHPAEELKDCPLQSKSQESEVTPTEDKNNEEMETVSLQKDPSRDLFCSLTTDERQEEGVKEAEDYELCIESDNNGKDYVSSNLKSQDTDSSSNIPLSNCEIMLTHDNAELRDEEENTEDSPKSKPNKLRLLGKLQQQGLVEVPDLPKLSGSPDSVINLDTETGTPKTPRDHGVLKLMDRLVQHSIKKKPNSSYDVNLSIIEKENVEGEQKGLKLKSVTYHVEEEKEELPSTAPGAKLALLKEKLGVGMKMKREEARMRRQQLFNLENEEGFAEKAESDNEELEEEAEMTDDESSSEEEEEEEDGFMNRMDNGSDDGEDYNPLLDTEAKEDDDEEDYGIDENSDDVRLRFEVSDEEEEDGDDNEKEESDNDGEDDEEVNGKDESTPVKGKKKARHRVLSDEEEDFCNLQRETISTVEEKDHLSDVESLPDAELTPLTKHFQDTQFHRDTSRSPELFGSNAFEAEESSNSTRHGDNLNDSDSYNPHSQMLDADGYLKMTQTQKPPKSRIGFLVDAPEDNAIMDAFESSNRMTAGKIFEGMSGQVASQADNMSELLGLCSGTFQQNSCSEDAINPSQNRRHDDDEGELSNPFHILDAEDNSDKTLKRKRIKPVLSDSEDEREGDTDIEEDSNNLSGPGKFTGFKNKLKKGIRKEFLEDEAELSGSEFDSDENVDLAEEDDILEEEAGDRDMAGVSEEELRNQVGKVHMKQLQDDDDRAVMRFKEMYLQDGDLHTDGSGRMRYFRWKEMGDSSQQDLFEHRSDEEHVEEDADEIKWRKERIEREKFLEESQQGGDEPNKELHKFGQLFVKRSDSTTSLQKNSTSKPKGTTEAKPTIKKKGSFLSRGKDALVKFAQVAKTALGGNSKQNSRSFVFQSKESQEEETEVEAMLQPEPMQPPKRKAHTAINSTQAAKKPRLAKNPVQAPPLVKRQGSIFNLLDP